MEKGVGENTLPIFPSHQVEGNMAFCEFINDALM